VVQFILQKFLILFSYHFSWIGQVYYF